MKWFKRKLPGGKSAPEEPENGKPASGAPVDPLDWNIEELRRSTHNRLTLPRLRIPSFKKVDSRPLERLEQIGHAYHPETPAPAGEYADRPNHLKSVKLRGAHMKAQKTDPADPKPARKLRLALPHLKRKPLPRINLRRIPRAIPSLLALAVITAAATASGDLPIQVAAVEDVSRSTEAAPYEPSTVALAEDAAPSSPEQPGEIEEAPYVSVDEGESAEPDPNDGPLRFTIPLPGEAPQSAWRPALYETPWALGPHDHFYFARPIGADEVNWPLADYRYGGIFFSSDIVHTGVDIPAPRGTSVLAAAPGRVVWAGYGLYYGNNDPDDPYGLAVTIRHDFGYEGKRLYTVYAHMQRILVVNGQLVQAGETIGQVGTTGFTTGPHVHFEVRTDSNSYFATLNPELWMAPPVGWGVLVGQVRNTNGSLLTEYDVVVRDIVTRQTWSVRTYGKSTVNSDPYFKENLVLSDLPAGDYEIIIDYLEERYTHRIQIHPGAITFFNFRGEREFTDEMPAEPDIANLLPAFNPQTETNP